MKQGRVTKLLASLAACVAGVAMMGVGVTSASAVETQPTVNLSITGDASALSNHTFKAVKLADYIHQDAEAGTRGVQTVATPSDVVAAIKDASGYATGDPMAQLVQAWSSNNTDETASPYAGVRRDFVNKLITKNAIKTAVAGSSLTATFTGASANFSLPNGIYLIEDTTAATTTGENSLPMLVSTKSGLSGFLNDQGTSNIAAKLSEVKTTKKRGNPTYNISDYVHYTVDSSVPVYTGATSFLLKVRDELSKSLTYNPSHDPKPVVKVGGNTLTAGTDYTFKVEVPGSPSGTWQDAAADAVSAGARLTFDLSPYIDSHIASNDFTLAGKPIEVTFEVMVNKDALTADGNNGNDGQGIPNQAHTIYTTNPSDEQHAINVPSNTVYVYTGGFKVEKLAADTNAALTGAKFSIYRSGDATSTALKFIKTADVGGVHQYRPAEEGETLPTTDPDLLEAPFKVNGLSDDTYVVKEKVVPAGYMDSKIDFTVKIDHSADDNNPAGEGKPSVTVTYTEEEKDLAGLVANADTTDPTHSSVYVVTNVRNVSQLPASGAAGIMMRVVAGLLLVGIAVGLYAIMRHTQRSRRVVRRH